MAPAIFLMGLAIFARWKSTDLPALALRLKWAFGVSVATAALLPLVPVGMGIGIWGQRRVDERIFYNVCYAMLVLAGVKLIYDGLESVFGVN